MPDERVTVLAVDIDNCLLHLEGKRQDGLSATIMAHLTESNQTYAGFYHVTHRAYLTMQSKKKELIAYQNKKPNDPDTKRFSQCFFTYQVVSHFEKASTLPCLAVSTLDDLKSGRCGIAYETVLKPFEIDDHIPNTNDHLSQTEITASLNTKNHQLLQTAIHAAKTFPKATSIRINFMDDNEEWCRLALLSKQHPDWPAQVRLYVYHHVAHTQSKITYFGEAKRDHAQKEPLNPRPTFFTPAKTPYQTYEAMREISNNVLIKQSPVPSLRMSDWGPD